MPGTYFVEWAVTGLFGYGALPWRLFDLALLAVLAASAVPLLRGADAQNTHPRPRLDPAFGVIWAACVFALLHARDGIAELGQRDLLMTALLSLAGALLMLGMRCPRRGLSVAAFAGFGLFVSAAATVEPPAIVLLPAWLACLLVGRSREPKAFAGPAAAATITAALPFAASLLWLVHAHALEAFLATMHHLAPLHASLFRLPARRLLSGTVSSALLPVFLLGLPPVLFARPWRSFEGAVLLLGTAFGALSFWMQGRGYPYHRYPSEWFLLVLWAWALPRARSQHWVLGACAAGAVLCGAMWVAPRSLAAVRHLTPQINTQGDALRAALEREGGARLDGRVQCLDMAGGCVTALLRMNLIQSTGYLYDCYAMAPVAPRYQAEQQAYRDDWMRAIQAHPPEIFIAFSDECGAPDQRYRVLAQWPALAQLLYHSYRLDEQWTPATTQRWTYRAELPYGFRIYRRLP